MGDDSAQQEDEQYKRPETGAPVLYPKLMALISTKPHGLAQIFYYVLFRVK